MAVTAQVRARQTTTPLHLRRGTVLIYVVLVIGALLAVYPFIWMILTAFKDTTEIAFDRFLPGRLRWENFTDAWNSAPFVQYFVNTAIMAVGSVAGLLFTSILAAYAFARMEFPGRDALFLIFLATMMIPGEVTLIPNFLTVRDLGWINTYQALIVPFTASAFYIFLLRQFFKNIPAELYDAAILDGAGHFTFLTRIVIPLSQAALFTVALLSFIGSYNSFLWPLIVTNQRRMFNIQNGLRVFLAEGGSNTNLLMAASALVIAPIVVLYFFTQRSFTEGIATTGLKG